MYNEDWKYIEEKLNSRVMRDALITKGAFWHVIDFGGKELLLYTLSLSRDISGYYLDINSKSDNHQEYKLKISDVANILKMHEILTDE